ncbi:M20/M25/M40 family metallo-hydrolase [Streptomyces sp. NPDC004539]|uniref:M20/M25/M40 family metallo-hydrolase n=1 Tax=Streptomyces sp. NPDC004539 TaxID=3154280 RepID=UPI0033B51E4E
MPPNSLGGTVLLPSMLADLRDLVRCESFSTDHAAVARSAEVVGALGARLLGCAPEVVVVGGVSHLRWRFGKPRVLVLGHHDTVWPAGSLRTRPWSVAGGVARGPGVLDMKAWLVQMFHALASLPSLDGVCVLVNGDEEVGSPTSRGLIEEAARGAIAAFVLEAAGDGGALKVARKGAVRYEIVVRGRAAHAGLEPGRGVNAAVEAAHQVLAVSELGGGEVGVEGAAGDASAGGTTVTPTLLSCGTSRNTVPALARISVDVRVPTAAEQDRVDRHLRGLTARTPGARLEVLDQGGRPPMRASAELFALAALAAAGLGQEPPPGIAVGGVSDANYTAAVGCPTLDGLGAVGGGAHSDDEYVEVAWMVPRARLLAELVARTLRAPGVRPAPRHPRASESRPGSQHRRPPEP